ncbi:hypothetical protein DDIC_00905 [Desulfovibrio desulfuricans]|uniref:Glycosyltransferase RgtA/B/C/D-like domain-containing protein n=1 Tax=Desulfovibrio desulfuricans TaxID=876 RepID=A0A4P7UFR1_DESDE|nr:glycosyltransferase family 39 protein [Desulfovibrio desulfuricans]QCC84459.1 hypothetical protein DDIC_00905 [Desulfovibrio desulfuricans]
MCIVDWLQKDNVKSKIAFFIYLAVTITFFCSQFSKALSDGVDWDLLEHLAMADRWPHFGYTMGASDGYALSTPYFPGVALLAVVVHQFFGNADVQVMLFIAAFFLVCAVQGTYLFYKHLDDHPVSFPVYGAASLAFCQFFLGDYAAYAAEFKPDSISIVFFLLTYLAITKKHFLKYIAMAVSAGAAVMCKQQIVFALGGLMLGVLLLRVDLKSRLLTVLSVGAGIVLSLAIILNIQGAFTTAVSAHAAQKWNPFQMWNGLNILVAYCIVIGFSSLSSFKNYLSTVISRKKLVILFPTMFYLFFSVLGGLRWGGNTGNTQVGIVMLIPFIFCFCRKKLGIDTQSAAVLAAALLIVIPSGKNIIKNYTNFRELTAIESNFREQLAQMGIKRIAICDGSYLFVRGNNFDKVVGIYTYQQYRLGQEVQKGNKKYQSYLNFDIFDGLDVDALICSNRVGHSILDYLNKDEVLFKKSAVQSVVLTSDRYDLPVYVKKNFPLQQHAVPAAK